MTADEDALVERLRENRDPLSPARGVMVVLAVALTFYVLVACMVYAVIRWQG